MQIAATTAEFDGRCLVQKMATDLAWRAMNMASPEPDFESDGRVAVEVGGVLSYLDDDADSAELRMEEYLQRLFNFTQFTHEVYIVSLVYVERLLEKAPGVAIAARDAYGLLLTIIIVAAKWCNDDCEIYHDSYYARVGGLSLQEFKQFEAYFVKEVRWELYVNPWEFDRYCIKVAAVGSTKSPLGAASVFSRSASFCSTSPGCSPLASEAEDGCDVQGGADDSDDGDLLGRPSWSSRRSIPALVSPMQGAGEESDDEGLLGLPAWSIESWLPVAAHHREVTATSGEARRSSTIVTRTSVVAVDPETDDDDGLPGKPAWCINSWLPTVASNRAAAVESGDDQSFALLGQAMSEAVSAESDDEAGLQSKPARCSKCGTVAATSRCLTASEPVVVEGSSRCFPASAIGAGSEDDEGLPGKPARSINKWTVVAGSPRQEAAAASEDGVSTTLAPTSAREASTASDEDDNLLCRPAWSTGNCTPALAVVCRESAKPLEFDDERWQRKTGCRLRRCASASAPPVRKDISDTCDDANHCAPFGRSSSNSGRASVEARCGDGVKPSDGEGPPDAPKVSFQHRICRSETSAQLRVARRGSRAGLLGGFRASRSRGTKRCCTRRRCTSEP
mmetsp:Transcript_83728/g.233503  ORF Transcript_83728/g.233503 Transcript_83728/m.233503 type:complete len:621 (+) Transcript_83728:91-1953(+)